MTADVDQALVGAFVLAAHTDFERVRLMLAEHPELRDTRWERYSETALDAAGHMGQRRIAEHLLEQGAPLTIYAAAMLGRIDDVRALLAQEPGIAERPGVHGIALIYHAALSGDPALAGLVLEHTRAGLDSALHAAARQGHAEMAGWLLAQGADPQVPDFAGKTPAEVARERGHATLAELLAP
jgi:hypothetical protein